LLASLRSAVTAFNGLENDGRLTSVLLNLQHAFEMLAKAILESKRVKVFDKRSQKSISLETAARLCQQTEGVKLSDEEAGTIRAIDALRDAEQHWYLVVEESLLYLYIRAGVTLFDDLLKRVFDEHLADHFPTRVLPISTEARQDLQLLVDREYDSIAKLLKPGRRGKAEAHARIRALLATEALTDPDAAEVRESDVRRVARGIQAGKSRPQVFPKLNGVGSLTNGSGLTVEVRLVKKGGLPVTYTSSDSEVEPAAIRMVDLEKKFYMGANELADRAGITRNKATALRRHLGIDANDNHFSHRFELGSQKLLRYSDNALGAMKDAKTNLDLESVWRAHRTVAYNKTATVLPKCDQPNCALSQT
jgi:hypothetical protein